jgi:Ser-tRNA(Ala) deacylase AlaX
MATELIYMQQGDLLEYRTTVQEVCDGTTLVLQATIFYPQGGGQPFDKGRISGVGGVFHVAEIRIADGIVRHIGSLEGEMEAGEEVVCKVDAERRHLHARIHSAGHLLDQAVSRAGYAWIPGKGFHFPEGPYVEYSGGFSGLNVEEARQRIEAACAELVAADLPVRIAFMDREEMERRLPFVPDYLPRDRPARVVFLGDHGIPCGGTHVGRLAEVGAVTVRKLKVSGDTLRVSYQVSPGP